MSGMSLFAWFLIVWGVVTGIFVILAIYRALIAMKEDDQLFLDPAESKLQEEQQEILRRINRITPYTKGFGFASAGLLVLAAGVCVYRALVHFQSP